MKLVHSFSNMNTWINHSSKLTWRDRDLFTDPKYLSAIKQKKSLNIKFD